MLELPKKISAKGFDCVVACATMVFMYWRVKRPHLSWNVSTNFNDAEWDSCYGKGLKYVRTSGVPLINIRRMLKAYDFPLDSRLEFLNEAYQLGRLIDAHIPPVVLYDHYYMVKGVKRTPWHAVVVVDATKELWTVIDPSREPKYISRIPKTDFEESWAVTENATVIIRPKTYKIRRRLVPSTTLKEWMETS